MIVLWHWLGCIYWLVSELEGEDGSDTWVPPRWLYSEDFSHQYAYAFFWAITVTLGVGWDIIPHTPLETVYTTLCIICGTIMYVTIIGSASSALASLDSTHLKRRRLWDAVNSYLHQHRVHTSLQVKIRGYFDYVWGRDIDLLEDQSITKHLPPSLQAELCVAVNHHLIQQVPAFRGLNIDTVYAINKALVRRVFLPDEIVIRKGDTATHMYFLCKGRIAVFLDPQENVSISELEEGDFFGEDSFFRGAPRNATCIAITYCDCLDLAYDAFTAVLQQYPQLRETIVNARKKRYQAKTRNPSNFAQRLWTLRKQMESSRFRSLASRKW